MGSFIDRIDSGAIVVLVPCVKIDPPKMPACVHTDKELEQI